MKYLYCEWCGSIFSEEDAGTKWREWGHGEKEVYACPDCKSTDCIVDAETCKICGKPKAPSSSEYCDDCAWKARKIWEKAVCEVMDIAADKMCYTDCESAFIEFLEDAGVI